MDLEKKELEFETLKSKNRLYLFIGIVCVVILLITVIVSNTFAKYRVSDSIPIIHSEINYKVPDLNMVSLYIANEEGEYTEADAIPISGYTLNTEQSYCGQSNNGEIIKDDTVSIVYENGQVNVLGITKKGTKCYLYFDEKTKTAREQILANYLTVLTRNDFSTTVTNITSRTIYKSLDETQYDNDAEVYYFAGNPTDNWVQFGGFYWRIIRINGDGSIRLIYSGDSESGPVETGEATQIGTSAFNEQYNDNAYVGYMYGTPGSSTYEETHANINDSTIKTVLDTWYQENLLRYSYYISLNAGFCGDRDPSTSKTVSNGSGGIGIIETYYGAYIRLVNSSKNLTFECLDPDNDLYTVNDSGQGNKLLNYPIGLITANEIAFAGGVIYGEPNNKYYHYTNQTYWTMSPCFFDNNHAQEIAVYSDGFFDSWYVSDTYGVRPVINLSPNVQITGSGTVSDPYLVQ